MSISLSLSLSLSLPRAPFLTPHPTPLYTRTHTRPFSFLSPNTLDGSNELKTEIFENTQLSG